MLRLHWNSEHKVYLEEVDGVQQWEIKYGEVTGHWWTAEEAECVVDEEGVEILGGPLDMSQEVNLSDHPDTDRPPGPQEVG